MKNLYLFIMSDGKTEHLVYGKGRQSACMKLTGMRVKAAMASGQIKSVIKVTNKPD